MSDRVTGRAGGDGADGESPLLTKLFSLIDILRCRKPSSPKDTWRLKKPELSALDSRFTAGELGAESRRDPDEDDDVDDRDIQRRIVRFFGFSGEGAAIGEGGSFDRSPSAVRRLTPPRVVGDVAALDGDSIVASRRLAGENIDMFCAEACLNQRALSHSAWATVST